MYTIAIGNAWDGMSLMGSFPDHDEAVEWAEVAGVVEVGVVETVPRWLIQSTRGAHSNSLLETR